MMWIQQNGVVSSVKNKRKKNPNVVGVDHEYRHSPPSAFADENMAPAKPACSESPVVEFSCDR